MTWQRPWVWAGIITVVLPLLIHLLGQRPATRLPFPSLRFFGAARPLPTSRTRLQDLLLLAVRVAIFLMAVAALAAPLVLTPQRRAVAAATVARAIIIDRSASMRRRTPDGDVAFTRAERSAALLGDSADAHILVVATELPRAVPGALSWLARQAGRRELIVISDFQPGALTAASLRAVPAAVGIRLVRIPMQRGGDTITTRARLGDVELHERVTIDDSGASATWETGGAAAPFRPGMIVVFSDSADAGAAAAAAAARSVATPLPVDTTRPLAIVHRGAAERDGILRRAVGLHTPWTTEFAARIAADPEAIDAASRAQPTDTSSPGKALVLLRNAGGRPVLLATEATLRDRERLILLPMTDAGTSTTAALLSAISRALANGPPWNELDPAVISDSVLRRWERTASANGATPIASDFDQGPYDGRWLWLGALLLLGAEQLLRRMPTRRNVAPVIDAES